MKLLKLFVRLQERVLHNVFGILAILRDVLGDAKELALVLADQRIVGRDIAVAHPCDQGYVWMRLELSCYRLDGRHGRWLRKIRRTRWGCLRGSVRKSVPDGGAKGQAEDARLRQSSRWRSVPLYGLCGNGSGTRLQRAVRKQLKVRI